VQAYDGRKDAGTMSGWGVMSDNWRSREEKLAKVAREYWLNYCGKCFRSPCHCKNREAKMIETLNSHRFQSGAALLDDVMEDWYTRIDTERLDCSDWLHCVLAQLYETYLDGLRTLNVLTPEREIAHGFDTDPKGDLTPLWLEEIARRNG